MNLKIKFYLRKELIQVIINNLVKLDNKIIIYETFNYHNTYFRIE